MQEHFEGSWEPRNKLPISRRRMKNHLAMLRCLFLEGFYMITDTSEYVSLLGQFCVPCLAGIKYLASVLNQPVVAHASNWERIQPCSPAALVSEGEVGPSASRSLNFFGDTRLRFCPHEISLDIFIHRITSEWTGPTVDGTGISVQYNVNWSIHVELYFLYVRGIFHFRPQSFSRPTLDLHFTCKDRRWQLLYPRRALLYRDVISGRNRTGISYLRYPRDGTFRRLV